MVHVKDGFNSLGIEVECEMLGLLKVMRLKQYGALSYFDK